MKTLVIGGGGREHAIAWKLTQSNRVNEVQVVPGNGGTEDGAKICNVAVSVKPPFDDIIAHCRAEKIDLVVVGPEAPLVLGLSDALSDAGIACFGACKEGARLEGSKAFTRELTAAAGVPTHECATFTDAKQAQDFFRSKSEPWWIKADGLAAGKGAVMPMSVEEGCDLLKSWLVGGEMGDAGNCVVIEEPLVGTEASVIAIADGETVRCFAPSQDHKRLLDNDAGPNTGGMGAFAPTPHMPANLLAEIERDFLVPTLRALKERGVHFRGFLYAGIMLTANGPRLLEYNVRLGDPEAQVILPLLENDLVDVIEAAMMGKLGDLKMSIRPGAAVTVVAAAEGYPQSPRKGDVIEGIEQASAALGDRGVVFHAGTKRDGASLVTNGGRVLSVTAWGDAMADAQGLAYRAIDQIRWPGLQLRRDIGRSVV